MKKIVFIAGLPRSGSTLLSAILNQNPRFQAGITDPLAQCVRAIVRETGSRLGERQVCDLSTRKRLITSLFENYYNDDSKEVFFNTNRGWPLALPIIKDIYPDAKMILMVRDLGWILDSFETLIRKNPYVASKLFENLEVDTVYGRCEQLMSERGTVGISYSCVKQAITSEYTKDIMIVDYEYFTKNPELTMINLYEFINESMYVHDFKNVESNFDEFDNDLQTPGLHTTRKEVKFIERQTIIPPDIWSELEGKEVWKIQNSKNS
jgi:sulfotransferase